VASRLYRSITWRRTLWWRGSPAAVTTLVCITESAASLAVQNSLQQHESRLECVHGAQLSIVPHRLDEGSYELLICTWVHGYIRGAERRVLRLSHVHGADAPPPQFPFVCLLVSGGHNLLLLVHGVGNYTLMGTTVDDAMGALRPAALPRARAAYDAVVLHTMAKIARTVCRKAHNNAHPGCHGLHRCCRAVRLLATVRQASLQTLSLFAPCTSGETRYMARPLSAIGPSQSNQEFVIGQLTGEAYDKIARLLGLDMQPNGGACLEAFARRGDPTRFPFQTPMKKQVHGSMLPRRLFLLAHLVHSACASYS